MIVINAKKLLCPMPVIHLSNAITQANIGDNIKIIATDKGVLHDIPAWCKVHNHKIIDIKEHNNEITLLIEKNN